MVEKYFGISRLSAGMGYMRSGDSVFLEAVTASTFRPIYCFCEVKSVCFLMGLFYRQTDVECLLGVGQVTNSIIRFWSIGFHSQIIC